MSGGKALEFARTHYPLTVARGGPRTFSGWMHRSAFDGAPPVDPSEPTGDGCIVLYAPLDRFPDAPTLAMMRREIPEPDPKKIRYADDLIVEGALMDGVSLDRNTFDPREWAVLPDFRWPETEAALGR